MRLCLAVVFAMILNSPALAGCRLALVLGFDVSGSINAEDYAIQQRGLIAALMDPEVQGAFLTGKEPVAFAVYEWSGQARQSMVAEWRVIRGPSDLALVAAEVAGHQRSPEWLPTGLGHALIYGQEVFGRLPEVCAAHVLDISGDGRNNDGKSPPTVYGEYDFSGITVNGLAIGEHEMGLVDYFYEDLIRGAGAFVEVAPKQVDFPDAIKRKLIRELSAQVSGDVGVGVPKG